MILVQRGLLFGLVALAMVTACGERPPDRSEVLAAVADQQIIPAYVTLVDRAEALGDAVAQVCDAPSSGSLNTAQQALADARWQWAYTEAIWVGPVMERRAWATIDWPIDADEIEMLIADDTVVLDQERLSRRIGSDQRGLGAVDYLLGGITASVTPEERRCQYLVGITEVITTEAAFLPNDWSSSFEAGDPYRSTFTEAEGSGLDAIVNDSLFLLEAIADAELGTALGAMEGPVDSSAIVEGPSGLGVVELEAHLAGLRDLYLGVEGDGDGLGPLLGTELVERLTEQFAAARVAVQNLDGPLRLEIAERPDSVAEVRTTVKALQATVATEVVARLGVTIGFSDADGDSG